MSSNLPPVVPVFPGIQFNSGFYAPNNEPITYEQMTTTFVQYPTAQGDVSMQSATFSGDVVISGDLSVNGTINGNSGGGDGGIVTLELQTVENQITPNGDYVIDNTANLIHVITNNLNNANNVTYAPMSSSGLNNLCNCIALDVSSGIVYASGTFTMAGGVSANYIAQWNGTSWSVVGDKIFTSTINNINFVSFRVTMVNNHTYNILQVCVQSNYTCAYVNPDTEEPDVYYWIEPHNVLSVSTTCIRSVYDYELNEYSYTYAGRGNAIFLSYDPYFFSFNPYMTTNGGVNAMINVPSSSPQMYEYLYVAGAFTTYTKNGTFQANNVVRIVTNPQGGVPATSALVAPLGGNGVRNTTSNSYVKSFAYDGTRNLLYVGGYFDTAGDVSANNIACWNITTSNWVAMGSGLNATCNGIAYDSARDLVYAVGEFTSAGGNPSSYIAIWNPVTNEWIGVNSGFNATANAIAYDAISNTTYVGGNFTTAGGAPANRIVKITNVMLTNTVNILVNNATVTSLPKNNTCIVLVAGGDGYNLNYTNEST